MSMTAYHWALAFHVFGVLLWIGAMVSLTFVLSSAGAKNDGVIEMGRKVARVMDIGGLIAIVCGVYVLIRTSNLGPAWALKQPWMHIKLTVVVVAVFGGHGIASATLGKLRRGTGKPMSPIVPVVLAAAALAIVILAIAKPLAKG